MEVRYYRYYIHFRMGDGTDKKVIVMARNEFEAMQLAGAIKYDVIVFSLINLDL